jgi:Spy/CpxP family protein refolding chaperone
MLIPRMLPALALIVGLTGAVPAVAQTAPATTDMSSPAPAQTVPHQHHHHHRQSLLHALRAVNMTDAQKQQVAAFHDQEQKANANADAPTRQANAATMRRQIMGILTPDQKAQLTAGMHKNKAPNAMPMPNPAPSPGAR